MGLDNGKTPLLASQMQKKLKALQEDEELKPMFDDMRTGGMPAMMKYFNNPEMLRKLGEKLGPIPNVDGPPPAGTDAAAAAPPAAQATSPAPEAPPAAPEVNDLLDAARCLNCVEMMCLNKEQLVLDVKVCHGAMLVYVSTNSSHHKAISVTPTMNYFFVRHGSCET